MIKKLLDRILKENKNKNQINKNNASINIEDNTKINILEVIDIRKSPYTETIFEIFTDKFGLKEYHFLNHNYDIEYIKKELDKINKKYNLYSKLYIILGKNDYFFPNNGYNEDDGIKYRVGAIEPVYIISNTNKDIIEDILNNYNNYIFFIIKEDYVKDGIEKINISKELKKYVLDIYGLAKGEKLESLNYDDKAAKINIYTLIIPEEKYFMIIIGNKEKLGKLGSSLQQFNKYWMR
ncbi:hypothetical protein YN1_7740 [Nanoarchaeota archaeon]